MLTHSRHQVPPVALPTVVAPRRPRVTRAAAVAAACLAVGGAAAAVVIADSQPAPETRSVAAPNPRVVVTHPEGAEANKAASMRALSLHIAERSAVATPRFRDLEANKAASQRQR